MKLLTRDEFRKQVFDRDNYKCVICQAKAVDAHHILERRLWPDGGYYLDNGASVCAECHLMCESTHISTQQLRERCWINYAHLPPHMYDDLEYDKWGNIIQPSGIRLKGELFFDESVQKVIKPYLHLFLPHVKYPRTYHLPWSKGLQDDDRMLDPYFWRDHGWDYGRVIGTLKYDGENTTMYTDYIHARSVDSRNHESRNWVKNFWSSISQDIPEGWRICGENMYAKHSIKYNDLKSYFYGFSIWNERNICLDWDSTLEWFELLGITPVPVIYDGPYNEAALSNLWTFNFNETENEGYVLRVANEISYADFRNKVGKYVRENHVQTVKHWMHGQRMEMNELCT